MPLIVQKFGGTSVQSVERICEVASKVIKARSQGYDVIVVLSAMAGETDRLIQLAHEISDKPDVREYDALVSTGEQVTIALLSMRLHSKGYQARSYTGQQAGILTTEVHKKARILDINRAALQKDLSQGIIPVIAGFQGINSLGDVTTLGRGGSDTSAVAVAAAMGADECQIYTDVEGVYTADPRIVPQARCLARITFEEMLELASLGAKVLQHRSLEFACKYNVPLRVLSSFKETTGTLVTYEDKRLEKPLISGVAYDRHQARFILTGLPNTSSVLYQLLSSLSNANIEIDMMVQSAHQYSEENEPTMELSFSIQRDAYEQADGILKNALKAWESASIKGYKSVSKVSIVGVGIRSHHGVVADMFNALEKMNIRTYLTSTSEIKMSVLIDEKDLENAIQALHKQFNLERLADGMVK